MRSYIARMTVRSSMTGSRWSVYEIDELSTVIKDEPVLQNLQKWQAKGICAILEHGNLSDYNKGFPASPPVGV